MHFQDKSQKEASISSGQRLKAKGKAM